MILFDKMHVFSVFWNTNKCSSNRCKTKVIKPFNLGWKTVKITHKNKNSGFYGHFHGYLNLMRPQIHVVWVMLM